MRSPIQIRKLSFLYVVGFSLILVVFSSKPYDNNDLYCIIITAGIPLLFWVERKSRSCLDHIIPLSRCDLHETSFQTRMLIRSDKGHSFLQGI